MSSIFALFDGTCIDLSEVVEIGRIYATESIQYPAAPRHVAPSWKSDLRFWFDVGFKENTGPRRYTFSLEDLLGSNRFTNEVRRQYQIGGLDSRNHTTAMMRADAALAQEAVDVLVQHRRTFVDAWVSCRNARPDYDSSAIMGLLKELLARTAKEPVE